MTTATTTETARIAVASIGRTAAPVTTAPALAAVSIEPARRHRSIRETAATDAGGGDRALSVRSAPSADAQFLRRSADSRGGAAVVRHATAPWIDVGRRIRRKVHADPLPVPQASAAGEGGVRRSRRNAGGVRERAADHRAGHLHAFPFADVRRPERSLHATISATRERGAVPRPGHARPFATLSAAPESGWRRRCIRQWTPEETGAVPASFVFRRIAPARAHVAHVEAPGAAIVDSRSGRRPRLDAWRGAFGAACGHTGGQE